MGGSSGKNRDATIKFSSFNPQTWGFSNMGIDASRLNNFRNSSPRARFHDRKTTVSADKPAGSASSFLATCKAGDVEDPSEDVEVRMVLGTCQGNCHPSINMGKI